MSELLAGGIWLAMAFLLGIADELYRARRVRRPRRPYRGLSS